MPESYDRHNPPPDDVLRALAATASAAQRDLEAAAQARKEHDDAQAIRNRTSAATVRKTLNTMRQAAGQPPAPVEQ